MQEQEYVLELKSITKEFPGVKALEDVSFNLKKGEIHALMGENGAGKSTFIKVITGVHPPNAGQIFVQGQEKQFQTPLDAQACGISAIYQHVTCYPDLSVTENIFMGHERYTPLRTINWKEMHAEAAALLGQLSADFTERETMGNLSVAQQQMVEIAKALSTNAQIIIMDEPTAALTQRESEELYRITKQLREDGKSIIFISHRFEDMYRLADRVTVLRDARYIGTWDIAEVNNDLLIMAMVGREIGDLYPTREAKIGKELFRAENLSCVGLFKDISFTVHSGEVVGLTGLVGSGRTEVCQGIYGINPLSEGSMYLEGKPLVTGSPKAAMKQGVAYLPEDRQKQGLVLGWPIDYNITLSVLEKVSKRGWIDRQKEFELAGDLFERLNIKAPSTKALAGALSGGNQQKVIVAKLLALDCKFIIMDEPTKGVDVGAKNAIFKIINELAEQGFGILLVSSEMPEVISMSDRILVMREGKIAGSMSARDATQEQILTYAMADTKTEGKEVS